MNPTYRTKLLVKVVNAWVCSAFGNVYTNDGDDDDDDDYHDSVEGVDDRWCCLRVAPFSLLGSFGLKR